MAWHSFSASFMLYKNMTYIAGVSIMVKGKIGRFRKRLSHLPQSGFHFIAISIKNEKNRKSQEKPCHIRLAKMTSIGFHWTYRVFIFNIVQVLLQYMTASIHRENHKNLQVKDTNKHTNSEKKNEKHIREF